MGIPVHLAELRVAFKVIEHTISTRSGAKLDVLVEDYCHGWDLEPGTPAATTSPLSSSDVTPDEQARLTSNPGISAPTPAT
jgi:hypothetical protein